MLNDFYIFIFPFLSHNRRKVLFQPHSSLISSLTHLPAYRPQPGHEYFDVDHALFADDAHSAASLYAA